MQCSTKNEVRRAVITGASGVIGRALIDELVAKRVEILLLLRPSARSALIPEHPLLHRVDCPLEGLHAYAQPGEAYDAFFHLAWSGTYGEAREDTAMQAENVRAACDAAALAARLGCRAFVGVGSQAEYGRVPDGIRLTPNTPCHPTSAYGRAKLLACERTRALCVAYGMRHAWARVLSVYGEWDAPHTLIMRAVEAFSKGERGAFTACDQIWDYLYARDAARALIAMAQCCDGTYVLGSGEARTLRSYVLDIRDAINPDISPRFGAIPYFEGQVHYLCADISALARDADFAPRVPFEEGVRRTLAWWRRQGK